MIAVNKMLNMMRMQSEAAMGSFSHTRIGTVSAYDPNNYAVKVLIQPNNVETGWLPIFSPWVGNGWGLFAPPSIGHMVKVHYQEGNYEAGIVSLRGFNDQDRPLPTPAGEFWLVHSTGSFLKIQNDGSVNIVTHTALTATVGGTTTLTSMGNVVATAPNFNLTGDVNVTGNITATGNISDGVRSMAGDRTIYNSHTHNDPQGGTTNAPNQPQ